MKIYWIDKKSEFRISPKNGNLNQSFVLLQELHLKVQKLYSLIRDGNKNKLTLEDVQTTTQPSF